MENVEKLNYFILKNEKKILFAVLLLAAISIFILALNVDNQWAQDSHWYMSLAKNLASGEGYTLDRETPFAQYPPGFPLLLMSFLYLFKDIQISGLILVGMFSILTLLIIYKIGKLFSPLVGLLSVTLLMTHNLFIFNTVSIMTEIPFMFFSLLGLYLFIKGFENPKYFISAFPVIAFSCLVRYAGFFLIFPMLFYTFVNFKKLKRLIFSDKVIIGIILGLVVFFGWFLRNFLTFGNPFYTSYSEIVHEITFQGFLTFIRLFFKLGFLFPYVVLIGIFFVIKSKDKKLQMFLIWFVVYFIMHASWWGGGVFRFYAGILPIICVFSAIGISKIGGEFNSKDKKTIFALLILGIIILSQLFIFFSGAINYETTIKTLNRYDSIQQISQFANENFPKDSIYLVPDIAVYSMYLPKENMFYYGGGINNLLQNPQLKDKTFIFADTLHSWMTQPFLEGENGTITLPLNSGQSLILQTGLVHQEEYKDHYTILLNVTNFGVM